MNEMQERFVQLEAIVKKDNDSIHKEIVELKQEIKTLSRDFHIARGEMHTVSELFTLFHKLDEKIEMDRSKRDVEHNELMNLLAKKMDSDKPFKWATNFQKVLQWIVWFFMLLGAFGIGNWMQASLLGGH